MSDLVNIIKNEKLITLIILRYNTNNGNQSNFIEYYEMIQQISNTDEELDVITYIRRIDNVQNLMNYDQQIEQIIDEEQKDDQQYHNGEDIIQIPQSQQLTKMPTINFTVKKKKSKLLTKEIMKEIYINQNNSSGLKPKKESYSLDMSPQYNDQKQQSFQTINFNIDTKKRISVNKKKSKQLLSPSKNFQIHQEEVNIHTKMNKYQCLDGINQRKESEVIQSYENSFEIQDISHIISQRNVLQNQSNPMKENQNFQQRETMACKTIVIDNEQLTKGDKKLSKMYSTNKNQDILIQNENQNSENIISETKIKQHPKQFEQKQDQNKLVKLNSIEKVNDQLQNMINYINKRKSSQVQQRHSDDVVQLNLNIDMNEINQQEKNQSSQDMSQNLSFSDDDDPNDELNEQTKNIIKQVRRASELMQKNFNENQNLSLIRHMYDESLKYLLIIIPLYIIQIFTRNYYVTNCQWYQEDLPNYCQTSYHQSIQKIKEYIFFRIGQTIFIYEMMTLNFQGIKHKIYMFICCMIFTFLNFIKIQEQIRLNILWLLMIFYSIFLKITSCLRYFNIIQRLFYQYLFLTLLNLFVIFINWNILNLRNGYLVVIQNIYIALMKSLILQYFKLKMILNLNDFEDLRLQLLILFLQDTSFNIKILLTSSWDELIYSPYFINQAVMIMYNLTQFHLWWYLIKNFIDAFFQYVLCNKFQQIKKFVNGLIFLIWIDFEGFIEKIKYKNYRRQSISIESISEKDILRIFSTYFIISNIWFYIFLLMMIIIQKHIPFVTQSLSLKYKIDVNDAQIQKEYFDLSVSKYLVTLIIITFLVIITHLYGVYKKKAFFSMRNLNKSNLFSLKRLFIIFFLGTLLNETIFI